MKETVTDYIMKHFENNFKLYCERYIMRLVLMNLIAIDNMTEERRKLKMKGSIRFFFY